MKRHRSACCLAAKPVLPVVEVQLSRGAAEAEGAALPLGAACRETGSSESPRSSVRLAGADEH